MHRFKLLCRGTVFLGGVIPIEDVVDFSFLLVRDLANKELRIKPLRAFYLLGMLSKSMGQILRVSVALHILFRVEHEDSLQDPVPDIISQEAIKAAINFVEVCCQHSAYISGHGQIDNELELVQVNHDSVCEFAKEQQHESIEALILGLPGQSLDVS